METGGKRVKVAKSIAAIVANSPSEGLKPVAAGGLPMAMPPTNCQVILSLELVLRATALCRDNAPAVVTAELLGLETSPGVVEVTKCFMIPPRRDIWNSRERADQRAQEEKYKKEVEKHRTKVSELLHYVDYDCQSVGWLQTLTHSTFADAEVVEQLFHRMIELDRVSMLLGFDMERLAQGKFPFRAFQLSEAYLDMRCRQESGDSAAGDLLRGMGENAILQELSVRTYRNAYADALLLQLPFPVTDLSKQEMATRMGSADQLVKEITALDQVLEEFTSEGDRLLKMHKDGGRYARRMDRRRMETKADADDAGDDDIGLAADKKHEPNQIRSVMMWGQVNAMADRLTGMAKAGVGAR